LTLDEARANARDHRPEWAHAASYVETNDPRGTKTVRIVWGDSLLDARIMGLTEASLLDERHGWTAEMLEAEWL
jgi:hypothetical protein